MAVQNSSMEDVKCDIRVPKKYKVIMYNDDFTPMDFVVEILINIFHKSEKEAVDLMLMVHKSESAVVGEFSLDIARTKANECTVLARENGYPFRVEVAK